MSKQSVEYVRDIVHELDDIQRFTSEGQRAFMESELIQKAVVRSYEIVGEICKRLPAELREAHPQIQWRKLITFRDFLAHNYDEIDLRYVWAAVEDVSALRAAFYALLETLEADDEA